MEKNVRILDVNGIDAGFTYPKRAKGLVKNGRAVYVDDCTIRFLHTIDPTTIDKNFDDSEGDFTMSNVICFNARDFKFDKSVDTNVGARMFITDMFGESVEVYELGDGKDVVSQIHSVVTLEQNTDYVFRFALTTNKDLLDGVTQFMIVPIEGEEETEDDFENRFIYNLSQNQYKSSLSKRWGLNLVRIYEIPFNTANISKFRLVFLTRKAIAKLFPARELSAYDKFQDFSYAGWLNDKKEQLEQFSQDFDFEKTVKGAGQATKKATEKATEVVSDVLESFFSFVKKSSTEEKTKTHSSNHSNENLDLKGLEDILSEVADGASLNISNCNIVDTEYDLLSYSKKDGLNVLACNSNFGVKAFTYLLKNIGDGCTVDLSNSHISGTLSEDVVVESSDGIDINLKNSKITSSALAALMMLTGDGANIDIQSAIIEDDGSNISFGKKADGVNLTVRYASIPDGLWTKINEKLGEGCNITDI